MTTNERQQRMAERILEDETLRGDLEDDAATALLNWASEQAASAAADPARSDTAVEADVQVIRQAARAAALSGETAPPRLIALASAQLAPSHDATHIEPPALSASASKPSEPPVAADISATEKAAPAADVVAVGEAPVSVVAAAPVAPSSPSASPAEPSSGVVPKPKPAKPTHPRRKRSRLARFYKHLLGGR